MGLRRTKAHPRHFSPIRSATATFFCRARNAASGNPPDSLTSHRIVLVRQLAKKRQIH
jgi:hypothetical protein